MGVARRIAAVLGPDLLAQSLGSVVTTVVRVRPDEATETPLTPMGEALEIIRTDHGLSQEAMAEAADISLTTYRRLISGEARPRAAWFVKWGEWAEMRDPEDMTQLMHFTGSPNPLHRAIGRQLHSWRYTAGLDLIDVADAVEPDVALLAEIEVGHEEVFTFLDDLAPLYGATTDIIFRAAQLAAPDEGSEQPVSINHVLTFEAAQRVAERNQEKRDDTRLEGSWDFESGYELSLIRARAGFTIEEVAKRLKRPRKLIELWEEGDREPDVQDFEGMAVLYRTTPWALAYGDAIERAYAFTNAPESRALLFARSFTAGDRVFLYAFLAELARIGMNDEALMGARERLTSPDHYYLIQFAETDENRALFRRAKLRGEAIEMWRHLNDPGWAEQDPATLPPLPPVFDDPTFSEMHATALDKVLKERWREISYAKVARSEGPVPPGTTPAIAEETLLPDGVDRSHLALVDDSTET